MTNNMDRKSSGRSSNKSKEPVQMSLARKFLAFFGFGKKESPAQTNRGKGKEKGRDRERRIQKHPVTSERLFIGNLSYSVKDSDLEKLFESAGRVFKAEVVTHRQSQRSKGYGFVTMDSVESAQKAVDLFDGETLDGRKISVTGAKSDGRRDDETLGPEKGEERNEREPSGRTRSSSKKKRPEKKGGERRSGQAKRGSSRGSDKFSSESTVTPMEVPEVSTPDITITNLSSDFEESHLEDLFRGVGSISEVEVSEGKASITMQSVEDAQEAVRLLDGKDFMGKTLSVSESS
jgi:RNA recognition motif-containing protein